MNKDTLLQYLTESFEDHRLSRTERQALLAVLSNNSLKSDDLNWVRNQAFELAKAAMDSSSGQTILDWLERVNKAIHKVQVGNVENHKSEALFSPGTEPLDRIIGLFKTARHSINVCVFTITDDRIANAMVDAHKRGINLRVMTDNDKAHDRGSDVLDLAKIGINVRVDQSPHHMHHKYAVFDSRTLLTGSYNWTRSAARVNQENILTTTEKTLVARFQAHFEALWNGGN